MTMTKYNMCMYTNMNTYTTQKDGRKRHTIDKNGIIRFDYLFSYWMFVWFVLYYFLPTYTQNTPITNIFKQYGNPLYVFYLGILENLVTLAFMLWLNPDIQLVLKFVVMMCIMKIYPAYLLYYLPTNWKINIGLFFIVFTIYNVYLFVNDTNIYEIYENTLTSIIYDRDLTPLYAYTKYIWNMFG